VDNFDAAIALFVYYQRARSEATIDSIAVLPFQNRSSDADTEYLSDGLAESRSSPIADTKLESQSN
jgi:TolB-like protein